MEIRRSWCQEFDLLLLPLHLPASHIADILQSTRLGGQGAGARHTPGGGGQGGSWVGAGLVGGGTRLGARCTPVHHVQSLA